MRYPAISVPMRESVAMWARLYHWEPAWNRDLALEPLRGGPGPQIERAGVDAVALAGGAGAVVEHVAQMATAALARHLGPDHEEALVRVQLDVRSVHGLGEAGPPGSRFELRPGVEELGTAPGASVDAIVVDVPVLAGEGPLGAFAPEHLVLLRREAPAPFLFAGRDIGLHVDHSSSNRIEGRFARARSATR